MLRSLVATGIILTASVALAEEEVTDEMKAKAQYSVGDCIDKGGGMGPIKGIEAVDCASDEAKSRITKIVASHSDCPKRSGYFSKIGAGNPVYCASPLGE